MTETQKAHHSEQTKSNLKSRLNRIEGQVKAINRMIDEDVYCDDVLTQIRATRSALNSVATKLLDHHMKSCIMDKVNQGEQQEAMDELLVTFQKLMKD
ncbi:MULTISPECIES: copper-sensing transcriptional repressor CsoR [Staphylococcus]|jgi:DNA-binding FrmR family transcriptional regulator|uniref:Copper-sensing transcriptional repressor CsoR n=1 Tax=Staphylococcus nepalensis TaxID=214473 RepID=A0A2T4SB06_9STAP|nr:MULTISPECIES: copper-sensing transcriptional repressor CsoR [Staphylococcus]VDG66579.1 copper-sensing transcriptional repressor CsoR [Lacrimispora indolis]MBO1207005.1 copper-sensing transcriptional repressor CsoR [Staphylococcus nepalensis]MBO1212984.1 copper-sensing transcriptional repressor CsoR [Staphylococcus nepalensis]MBO1217253.1 copper-sensing transcriptional repressor CsoR [Staphylococcus nepalensis]MBO1222667.1 copper-sensing transcriptional repressor CsoR [Staphylococcus nepalen